VSNPPPPDVVPSRGMSRAEILRANAAAGSYVQGTVPGRVELDVDGKPLAAQPCEPFNGLYVGLTITQREADDAGLSQEGVRNVIIVKRRAGAVRGSHCGHRRRLEPASAEPPPEPLELEDTEPEDVRPGKEAARYRQRLRRTRSRARRASRRSQ
jgi:hypothetical protein